MNQTFNTMAIAKALNAPIINPLDERMMAAIIPAEALAIRGNFCLNYPMAS